MSYAIDITDIHKSAIKYKLNDCSLWIDGFKTNTDSVATMPTGFNQIHLASENGLSRNLQGKAKAINVYQTALTDAELEYLTSYRSLAEMVTELNLNAL